MILLLDFRPDLDCRTETLITAYAIASLAEYFFACPELFHSAETSGNGRKIVIAG